MNIQKANQEDLSMVKDLWRYCFRDTFEYIDYYFENIYEKDNNLVMKDKQEVVASLMLNKYKIVINEKEFDTSYVVGVSTSPSFRGKGKMKDLIKASFDSMSERKNKIAILMPIDHRLYRPYGFEDISDIKNYELEISSLRGYKSKGDFIKIKNENIKQVVDIYENQQKNANAYAKRDEKYYENILKEMDIEDGHGFIYKENGLEKGYIIYFFIDDYMFVREMFYQDKDTLESFLSLIYNHNTQLKKVKILEPSHGFLKDAIKDFNEVKINIKPFMMGRVVDFEGFIKEFNFEDDVDGDIVIKLNDPYISSNNNVFEIMIKNGIADIKRTIKNHDLEIDINGITQWLFSYRNIEELLFMEKAELFNNEKLNLLKKLIIKKNNYINEYV